MAADASPAVAATVSLAERLERGDIILYPTCPFPLPQGEDRQYLLGQQLGGRSHKNISYDPVSGKTTGFRRESAEQARRLRDILAAFAELASRWLAQTLPRYADTWRRDRVSFRPEEEATRRLRWNARNDLLHVDAFPTRPARGWRILRLFANINPTEPRVWVTSDPFAKLLARYGAAAGLPAELGAVSSVLGALGSALRARLGLFLPGRRRTPYDRFMLRFHDFLKANDDFQEHGPKRFWHFPPGSAWLVFTDTASHAALRGRFALDYSFFVAPEALALPGESPAALLERACGLPVLERAA